MSDKDKRTGWLRELKANDYVILWCSNYGDAQEAVSRVESVTPTGRINVGGKRFNETGSECGVSGYGPYWFIKQWSPEEGQRVAHKSLVRQVSARLSRPNKEALQAMSREELSALVKALDAVSGYDKA